MANLFKAIKPSVDLQRNAFDRSRFDTFSTNGGYANPVFAEEVIPDEYLEIRALNGIQTSPLFTNNFMRAKQYIDYYFVPFTLIYRRFYQFYSTRKDNHMAIYAGDSVPEYVPTFNLYLLLDKMQDSLSWSYLQMAACFGELYSQLGSITPTALNYWKKANSLLDDSGQIYVVGTLRLLDMLGYGSYYAYFDIDVYTKLHNFLKSYLSGGIEWNSDLSFLDHLSNPTLDSAFEDQYPNLWRLAAYQYAWQCYYRNSYWDYSDFSKCFNFDDFGCTSVNTSDFFQIRSNTDIYDRYKSPFMLRCRQWKKDCLTGLMQTPQYGALSTVAVDLSSASVSGTTGSDIGRWKYNSLSGDLQSEGRVATSSSNNLFQPSVDQINHDHKLGLTSIAGDGVFDVYALRKAEMIQKWRETLLRAGNKTSDIFEGVFGKRPKFDDDISPIFIGSVDANISVTPVISQANTAKSEGSDYSSNLGDVAGRSTSALKSDKIDFRNSGDFGVVIGIMTILPEAEYDAIGLDRANTLVERADYWNPMYQNLGLEANFAFQFNNVFLDSGTRSTVIGYAPRYMHHKAAINKVHGHFMSRGAKLPSTYDSGALSAVDWRASGGSLRYWSIPRVDVDDYISALNYVRRLYVSPFVFDNAFIKQVDESQDSDQFYVELYHDVKKVAPLSVLGLPRW